MDPSTTDGLPGDAAPETDVLAHELGALAAGTDGVTRVQARPGAVEIARQAIDGIASAVATVTGRWEAAVAVPAGPDGRPQPLVTLVVTDDETRVVLDLAVDETASAPAVARAVSARLLDHLAARGLPEPTIDVRVVGVSS